MVKKLSQGGSEESVRSHIPAQEEDIKMNTSAGQQALEYSQHIEEMTGSSEGDDAYLWAIQNNR